MKQSLRLSRASQRSGFTLIELLVVMSIIAILASVLFAVGNGAIKSAKRAQTQQTAQQIQLAVNAYFTEYGVYPVTPGASGSTPTDAYYDNKDSGDWVQLTEVLAGNVNTVPGGSFGKPLSQLLNGLNSHAIVFLSPKSSDLDSLGAYKNPFTTTASPTYYYIVIDSDYSNTAGDSGSGVGAIPDFPNSTTTNFKYLSGGILGTVGVWINNDQTVGSAGNNNPTLWSRTF